jgi:hypothetical protein
MCLFIYLFVVYLTVLPVVQTIHHCMTGRLTNWQGHGSKLSWPNLRNNPGMYGGIEENST